MKITNCRFRLISVFTILLAASCLSAQADSFNLGGTDHTIYDLFSSLTPQPGDPVDNQYTDGFYNDDATTAVLTISFPAVYTPGETNYCPPTFGRSDGDNDNHYNNFRLIIDTQSFNHADLTNPAGYMSHLTLGAPNYHTGGTELMAGAAVLFGTNDVFGSGDITLDGGLLIFTAGMNLSKDILLNSEGGGFRISGTGDTVTLSGKISGAGDLHFARDNGTFLLTDSANDYTGNTVIGSNFGAWSNGDVTVRLGDNNALSSTTGKAITVTGNGILDFNGKNQTISGRLDVQGGGQLINSGGLSTLTLANGAELNCGLSGNFAILSNSGGNRVNGVNTFTGGTRIEDGSILYVQGVTNPLGSGDITFNNGTLSFDGNATIDNKIVLNGSGGSFRMRNGGYSAVFNGQITGSGDFQVAFDNGRMVLTNQTNDYTGKTIIGSFLGAHGSGTAELQLGNHNVLPAGTTLSLRQMTLASLDMAGYNATVQSVEGLGIIKNSTATVSVLTITDPNASRFLDYITVQGNVQLEKAGTGTLILSSKTWSFTEPFLLKAGTLQVSTDNAMHGSETYKITGNASVVINTNGDWGRKYLGGNINLDPVNQSDLTEFTKNVDREVNMYYAGGRESLGVWPDNTTWYFSSVIEVTEDTPMQFRKYIDDSGAVKLTKLNPDGSLGDVLIDFFHENNHGTKAYTDYLENVEAGKYLLEFRVAQGGGGVGAMDSQGSIAVSLQDSTDAGAKTYLHLNFDENGYIPGTNGVLRAAEKSRTIGSKFEIAGGTTFTLEGMGTETIVMTGEISGDGGLKIDAKDNTMVFAAENKYKGGTQLAGKVVAGNNQAFSDGGISLTDDAAIIFDTAAESRRLANSLNLGGNSLELTKTSGANEATFAGRVSGGGSLDASGINFEIDLNALMDGSIWLDVDSIFANNDTTFTLIASDLGALTDYLENSPNPSLQLFSIDSGGLSYEALAAMIRYDAVFGDSYWSYAGGSISPAEDAQTPEPATWAMMLLAGAGLLWMRKRCHI